MSTGRATARRPLAAGPRLGVLGLQGDVREHARVLEQLGAQVTLVQRPGELDAVDGPVIPGGESTVIDRPTRLTGLQEPLIEEIGPEAELLAALPDGRAVAARQGRVMGLAFHPESTGETRFHELLLRDVRER